MSVFSNSLQQSVNQTFGSGFTSTDANQVPESEDLPLGNVAKKLEGVVLYADLRDSTGLVDGYKWWFAAKIYKSFLYCAAKIIRHRDGSITAYDGDRIMGVFMGGSKNTNAALAALNIHWAVSEVIQPKINAKHPDAKYELRHTVGVDRSQLHAARTGIRGNNDLVWIGRAANRAAKLSEMQSPQSWITEDVFDMLPEKARISSDGKDFWRPRTVDGITFYTSSWWVRP